MSSRRLEIQKEFQNSCEGIPAGIPEQLLKPHAKRARGTVADFNILTTALTTSLFLYKVCENR